MVSRFIIIIITLCSLSTSAQSAIEKAVQFYQEQNNNEISLEELTELLVYYEQNPLNINEITQSDIERFPLISFNQFLVLQHYQRNHGLFYSAVELYDLPRFSKSQVDILKPFIVFQSTTKPNKIDVFWLSQLEFTPEERAGNARTDSGRYLGSYARYYNRLSFGDNRQRFNVSWEKDKGEAIAQNPFRQAKYTYNYFSDNKKNQIILGNYNLQIGEGLIHANSYFFGKSSIVNSAASLNKTVRPNTGSAEFNYENGLAFSLTKGPISITPFFSYNKLHGGLENDTIKSIKTDGLFRSEQEKTKINAANVYSYGTTLNYEHNKLLVGLNTIHRHFSKPYQPKSNYYNKHYGLPKDLWNGSISYRYYNNGWLIKGETATDQYYNFATTHFASFYIQPDWQFIFNFRYFPEDYLSYSSSTFQENSKVQNEQGFFLGTRFKIKFAEFTLLKDFFKFPNSKYMVHGASNGSENMLLATFNVNDRTQIKTYFKEETKYRNLPNTRLPSKGAQNKRHAYLKFDYEINDHFKMISRVDFTRYTFNQEQFVGQSVYQDFIFRQEKQSANFRLAFFDATNWETRIYLYEYDLLYSFSIPAYYLKGVRFYFNYHYRFSNGIDVRLKFGQFIFPNETELSSGDNQIEGNTKTDLKIQLVWHL